MQINQAQWNMPVLLATPEVEAKILLGPRVSKIAYAKYQDIISKNNKNMQTKRLIKMKN